MPSNKNALKYSSLGIQMALTIGLAAWGGQYLDKKYNASPTWTIVFILLGIAIALYQVIKEVTRLSEQEEKPTQDEKS